jgi:hypothetical protein
VSEERYHRMVGWQRGVGGESPTAPTVRGGAIFQLHIFPAHAKVSLGSGNDGLYFLSITLDSENGACVNVGVGELTFGVKVRC